MLRALIISLAVLIFSGLAFAKTMPEPKPDPPVKSVKHILPEHKHSDACEKTSAEPVQIVCILDRSGSMSKLAADTIGGYNSFIAQQKEKSGAAQVTVVLFDDQYEKILDAVDLQTVPELTSAQYFARGNTALMDAVGRTIVETLANMERDGVCPAKRHVLFLIMTDGYENASKEFSKPDVKALVEGTTKNYNWNYVFIGANIDAASEATSIGISGRHALKYEADSAGVRKSFERMNSAAEEVRERGTLDK